MYRFKVTLNSANYTGDAVVYMFAQSYNDVVQFFQILNPHIPVTVEQVSDTVIGI